MSRNPQRNNRFVPRVELLEDRWAPADLGMPSLTATGTYWQTFEHDDMRTGASTVSTLITTPTIAWVSGSAFGGDGSPGGGAVIAPGIGGAHTHDLSDATGAQVAAFGTTTYATPNAVTLNPVIDGAGSIYMTNNSTSVMKIAPNGSTVWTTLRPDFSGSENDNVTTDPFVDNTSGVPKPYVYFGAASPDGNQGMIYAVNDADGTLAHTYPVTGRPIAISSNSDGSKLYVRTTIQADVQHSYIYALSATDLSQTWRATAGGPFIPDGYGAITVDSTSGDLYYMRGDGYLAKLSSAGVAGPTAYLQNEAFSTINLDSTAGIVYVSGGSFIHAFNAGSLAPLWSYIAPANALFTAPALAVTSGGASALYFVTTTGTLYSVNAATGTQNFAVDLKPLVGQEAGAKIDSATIIDSAGHIIYNDQFYGAVAITTL